MECSCPSCGNSVALHRPAAAMAGAVSPDFGVPPPPPPPMPGGGAYTAPQNPVPPGWSYAESLFAAFWLCGIIGGVLTFLWGLLLAIGVQEKSTPLLTTGLIVLVLCMIPLLIFKAMLYILLYQYWKLAPSGTVETSPLISIALMFVPAFNLYWFGASLPKLARALQERSGLFPAAGPAGHILAAGLAGEYLLQFVFPWLIGVNLFVGVILAFIFMLASEAVQICAVIGIHKSARQIALNNPELLA